MRHPHLSTSSGNRFSVRPLGRSVRRRRRRRSHDRSIASSTTPKSSPSQETATGSKTAISAACDRGRNRRMTISQPAGGVNFPPSRKGRDSAVVGIKAGVWSKRKLAATWPGSGREPGQLPTFVGPVVRPLNSAKASDPIVANGDLEPGAQSASRAASSTDSAQAHGVYRRYGTSADRQTPLMANASAILRSKGAVQPTGEDRP